MLSQSLLKIPTMSEDDIVYNILKKRNLPAQFGPPANGTQGLNEEGQSSLIGSQRSNRAEKRAKKLESKNDPKKIGGGRRVDKLQAKLVAIQSPGEEARWWHCCMPRKKGGRCPATLVKSDQVQKHLRA